MKTIYKIITIFFIFAFFYLAYYSFNLFLWYYKAEESIDQSREKQEQINFPARELLEDAPDNKAGGGLATTTGRAVKLKINPSIPECLKSCPPHLILDVSDCQCKKGLVIYEKLE